MNSIIHGINADLLRAAFCGYFGISEEHADILIVLWQEPGKPIPTRDLAKLVNSHRPPSRSALQERIRFLREIMDAESLCSGGFLDASGYYLSEVGMAECVKALRVMADALLRCGPSTVLAGRNVEDIRRGVDTLDAGAAARTRRSSRPRTSPSRRFGGYET